MTKAMVEALEQLQSLEQEKHPDTKNLNPSQGSNDTQQGDGTQKAAVGGQQIGSESSKDKLEDNKPVEPILENPKIGNPISHGQVVDLSKQMKDAGLEPCRLEILLIGSRIYIPPPPPKPEQVS